MCTGSWGRAVCNKGTTSLREDQPGAVAALSLATIDCGQPSGDCYPSQAILFAYHDRRTVPEQLALWRRADSAKCGRHSRAAGSARGQYA
jgi:hypothetical protein